MPATTEKLKYAIPFDKEYAIIHGHRVAFAYIGYDHQPENPLEDCDAMGSIQSFCRRHANFMDPAGIVERDGTISSKEHRDGVVLSYFEHGQCQWFVRNTDSSLSTSPDFRWDGVTVAGLWMPDKCLLEELGKKRGQRRRDQLVEWAKQACEAYTKYCNGEIYEYRVRAYELRRDTSGNVWDTPSDYRRSEEVFEDATCGYDDVDYLVKECMANSIKHALQLEEVPELEISYHRR